MTSAYIWARSMSGNPWIRKHYAVLTSLVGLLFVFFIHYESWSNSMLGQSLIGFHWTFFNVELLVMFDLTQRIKTRTQLTITLVMLAVWFRGVFKHPNWPSLVMVTVILAITLLLYFGHDWVKRGVLQRQVLFYVYAFCVLNIARLSNGNQSLAGWCRQIIALIMLRTGVDFYFAVLDSHVARVADYEHRAEFDTLTGLRHLDAFTRDLENRFAAFQTGGPAYSIYTVDVDLFKRINDTYGHPVGSSVLHVIAQRLAELFETTAPGTRVYRTGGEEFTAIVLEAESTTIDAVRLAREVQASVAALDLTEVGAAAHVTVSVGESVVDRDDHSYMDAYRRADQYLYNSKRSGRNKITVQGELVDLEAE